MLKEDERGTGVEVAGECVGLAVRLLQPLIDRPPASATVVSHLGLFLVLLISLRFVGVSEQDVGWAEVLGVFAFARLLTAVPITPGGLGVVELAYIGGLVLAGRNHTTASPEEFRAQVAAGVLLFRALTYGAQIPLGGITYLIWRQKKSWRKDPKEAPQEPAVPVPAAVM